MAQDGLSPADLEHHKMILGGVERRAQIDTETFKALLLINGGGILALLTFSSVLLARPGQEGFLRCIFIAIMLLRQAWSRPSSTISAGANVRVFTTSMAWRRRLAPFSGSN